MTIQDPIFHMDTEIYDLGYPIDFDSLDTDASFAALNEALEKEFMIFQDQTDIAQPLLTSNNQRDAVGRKGQESLNIVLTL